jgi:hypothetical protein
MTARNKQFPKFSEFKYTLPKNKPKRNELQDEIMTLLVLEMLVTAQLKRHHSFPKRQISGYIKQ